MVLHQGGSRTGRQLKTVKSRSAFSTRSFYDAQSSRPIWFSSSDPIGLSLDRGLWRRRSAGASDEKDRSGKMKEVDRIPSRKPKVKLSFLRPLERTATTSVDKRLMRAGRDHPMFMEKGKGEARNHSIAVACVLCRRIAGWNARTGEGDFWARGGDVGPSDRASQARQCQQQSMGEEAAKLPSQV